MLDVGEARQQKYILGMLNVLGSARQFWQKINIFSNH